MHRIAPFALVALAVSLAACASESVTEVTTPDVQMRQMTQLSAGGGIAGYDFFATIDGVYTRFGTLLVIEDASSPSTGYYDETEYWRFDPVALDVIESGDVDQIDVDFIGKRGSFDQKLADHFESGTSTWTAMSINRLFDLSPDPTVVWNDPAQGHILYTMEGRGWGHQGNRFITYYLELDFASAPGVPEMVWYIDYEDFQWWQASRGDDKRMYEVRLTNDSQLNQTAAGVGYELKTLK